MLGDGEMRREKKDGGRGSIARGCGDEKGRSQAEWRRLYKVDDEKEKRDTATTTRS